MIEYDFDCEYCEGTGKGYIIHANKPREEVSCWHCNFPELELEK